MEFEIRFVENYPVINLDGKTVFVDLGAPSMSRIGSISLMGHDYHVKETLGPDFNLDTLEERDFHVHLDALLGIDILRNYEVVFDYPNSRLTLGDKREEHEGEAIPFTFEGVVKVEAKVEGKAFRMLVDSGCKECFIKSSMLQNRPVVGTVRDYLPLAKKVVNLNLSELAAEVGPLNFTAKWASQPYEGSVPFDGTLGYGFLSQKKMTFDFERQCIWLG